jgi:two-component system sensor histidine kinase MtrB
VFRLTLPRRPGAELVRSPLRLERPFDRDSADAAVSSTPTGEIRIGPDLLPDLEVDPVEDVPHVGPSEGERR